MQKILSHNASVTRTICNRSSNDNARKKRKSSWDRHKTGHWRSSWNRIFRSTKPDLKRKLKIMLRMSNRKREIKKTSCTFKDNKNTSRTVLWNKWLRTNKRKLKTRNREIYRKSRLVPDNKLRRRHSERNKRGSNMRPWFQEWNRKSLNWFRDCKIPSYYKRLPMRILKMHWWIRVLMAVKSEIDQVLSQIRPEDQVSVAEVSPPNLKEKYDEIR